MKTLYFFNSEIKERNFLQDHTIFAAIQEFMRILYLGKES